MSRYFSRCLFQYHPNVIIIVIFSSDSKSPKRNNYTDKHTWLTRCQPSVSRFFHILRSDVRGESLQRTELTKTRLVFQNLIGYRKHARAMGLPNQHLVDVMDCVRLTGSSHWYQRLDGARRRQTATKIHFSRTYCRDEQICWLADHISSQVSFMAHTFLLM
jgi:hypothetical protein